MAHDAMRTVDSLDALTDAVHQRPGLYVRWSRGPQRDLQQPGSADELTGTPMPGLSANPMRVEDWWGERSLRTWVARRLYDYRHLAEKRGPGVRPWLLEGRECGHGPDNEPLVTDVEPVAWLSDGVVDEAVREIEAQPAADDWGSLRRR